jgi:hypothetical protein
MYSICLPFVKWFLGAALGLIILLIVREMLDR